MWKYTYDSDTFSKWAIKYVLFEMQIGKEEHPIWNIFNDSSNSRKIGQQIEILIYLVYELARNVASNIDKRYSA